MAFNDLMYQVQTQAKALIFFCVRTSLKFVENTPRPQNLWVAL